MVRRRNRIVELLGNIHELLAHDESSTKDMPSLLEMTKAVGQDLDVEVTGDTWLSEVLPGFLKSPLMHADGTFVRNVRGRVHAEGAEALKPIVDATVALFGDKCANLALEGMSLPAVKAFASEGSFPDATTASALAWAKSMGDDLLQCQDLWRRK